MKLNTRLRRAAPSVRTRRGRIASGFTRTAVPVATLLALAASALLAVGAFAAAAAFVPVTIPVLLASWAVGVALVVALPLAVVRAAVAVIERTQ
ncbi:MULTISPECIES: hypothetical protein [Halorussus]|uniref:hypothetical protein n=1 Tax=Halorussus TaxID=1070314 RepID=UPI000E210A79|nr:MULTISPECIES: hypothetical protein [Halorussus]NHN60290.1 hypothetical protein [Halorussus sp. JP-T4]